MNTRRSFIKTISTGTALSAFALSSTGITNALPGAKISPVNKPIRIGIIGAENSHTIGFGKLFNIDKLFPGVEVKYVWGETEEFARAAMDKGQIPNRMEDPMEMLGKIEIANRRPYSGEKLYRHGRNVPFG
ncbi:MAG: hypothetical protein Q8N05_18055 [Bacteroidota bacterium]|nr:hypothetical protein [Bacteroidota bacterium]